MLFLFASAVLFPGGGTAAAAGIDNCLQAQKFETENKLQEAISAYTSCLGSGELNDALRAGAYVSRGTAYGNAGDYDKAEADFARAITLNPRLSTAYNNRANLLRRRGRHDQAIEDYSRAIQNSPQSVALYSNRGNAYKSLKHYDKAIADFDKAISLDPSAPLPNYNRACLESIRGNAADACAWLGKAMDRGFKSGDLITLDPDLEPIRESACYKKLMRSK